LSALQRICSKPIQESSETVKGCHAPLIIVGASVRAAAQSAIRAGFTPWCADQFADEDLRDCAHLLPLSDFPNGVVAALQAAPQAPWFYTGGLENRSDLVAELSRIRPLFGNDAETLRRVRDPFWIAETLAARGLPSLKVETQLTLQDTGSCWLSKPLASAGGIGIELLNSQLPSPIKPGCYLQEYATGVSVSGLYLGTANGALLLGMSQQLGGDSAIAGRPFAYAGSIAPLNQTDLPQPCFDQAAVIGATMAEHSQLRGLFGIDFIFDADQSTLWTLEVNPRYPASAELYEFAYGWPLVRWHVAACKSSDELLPEIAQRVRDERHPQKRFGKRVLYAQQDLVAPDLRSQTSKNGGTWIADIPRPGSVIPAGMPICTLLTTASSAAECEENLKAAANQFLSRWITGA
jgi:predicted ATP-grasp superfamily ATP-dependent carboligase